MLTPSCDLLPSTSFSSLIIDSAYQQDHLLPLEPGMSGAEALTLADFGFPDEEAVQQAEDSWFVGRQVEETKPAARNAKSNLVPEAVDVAPTKTDLGEESAAASGYGYTAFRAANPNPDGKKRKGRPVGWRKSVHMKPKTEVSNKAPPATAAHFGPSETKNDREDEIKVEPPPVPAPDAPLSSDSDIQKSIAKSPHPSPALASTGYAAFRLANLWANKLGRPVGWKMGVHGARKKVEKEKSRKKSSKKLAGSKDGLETLASVEMKKGQEAPFFGQTDGEVSMQLDRQQNEESTWLQLDSPTYDNFEEQQEAMEDDENSPLPGSFWEGVLAAANAPIPTTDLTSSKDIIETEPYNDPGERSARRDSAFDIITPPIASFAVPDEDALPDSADETTQDYESGSSDMSHFSA